MMKRQKTVIGRPRRVLSGDMRRGFTKKGIVLVPTAALNVLTSDLGEEVRVDLCVEGVSERITIRHAHDGHRPLFPYSYSRITKAQGLELSRIVLKKLKKMSKTYVFRVVTEDRKKVIEVRPVL